MKIAFSLMLLLFSVSACNGQLTPAGLEASVKAGIDPYFIESTDTISTHGPNHITRDVLQDRAGHFWFATWLGIIEYDGKVFTNHTLKDGLIHFHVFSLFEDTRGNIWIGTVRGGLYRYSPAAPASGGKAFTLFTTKDGLADNTVTCMAEDKGGNIWFGTQGGGVSRYNASTDQKGTTPFTKFTDRDGLSGNDINSIMLDKAGKLWFGTMDGISRYDGKSFAAFTDDDGAPIKKVLSLLEDKRGNIWIGRFDGLTRYDPLAGRRKGGTAFTHYLSNLMTSYIVEDKAGNIWLTHSEPNTHYSNLANQVLYRYDGKAFTRVIEKYEPNDFQIFGKTVDKDGKVWFGTMHGPCRYDPKIREAGAFTYFTE